jgi:uncharacterized Zn finger protein (UPF0148 family)
MTNDSDLKDGEILCPFCGEAATDGTCLRAAAERIATLTSCLAESEADNARLRKCCNEALHAARNGLPEIALVALGEALNGRKE